MNLLVYVVAEQSCGAVPGGEGGGVFRREGRAAAIPG